MSSYRDLQHFDPRADPRGVRQLACIYSMVPPAVGAWSEEVAEAFRSQVDPHFLPMSVRTVYQTTAGAILKFDRHVIATAEANPVDARHREFRRHAILRPTLWAHDAHEVPWSLLDILEAPVKGAKRLPGPFIPLSYKHVLKYRAKAKLADAFMAEHPEADRDEFRDLAALDNVKQFMEGNAYIEKAFREESDYRWDTDWKHLMSLRDQLDVDDLREIGYGRAITEPIPGRSKRFVGHTLGR